MFSRSHIRVAAPLAAVLAFAALPAQSQARDIRIPRDTVVRVEMDRALDGTNVRQGDRISATLSPKDRSGLPLETRFEGVVTEAQRRTDDRPGVIDTEFRYAILPGGERVEVIGQLAGLGEEDVRRTPNGRLVSRAGKKADGGKKTEKKFNAKWVGYGAGAGAILATITGSSFFRGALLGGLGGAVFGYLNKDKKEVRSEDFREVSIARGTEFGIRLEEPIVFATRDDFRFNRAAPRDEAGRLARPEDARYGDIDVRLDDKAIVFGDVKPLNLNGQLFVPLRPIAAAAQMDFQHRVGEDTFTVRTEAGQVRGTVGEVEYSERAAEDPARDEAPAMSAPLSLNGEIYVAPEYLSRVLDLRVNWRPAERRLALRSYDRGTSR